MNSAVELAALALEEESNAELSHEKRHTACVIGSVVCSAAFLECTINGLYEGAKSAARKTKFHKALTNVWIDAFERLPILAKYQLALTLARCDLFKTGEDPYQSAEAVIELRNAIAHPKEIIESKKNQQKLEKKLRARYKFGIQRENCNDFFPDRCLSAHCAIWSARATIHFSTEFKRRLPSNCLFLRATRQFCPRTIKQTGSNLERRRLIGTS